LSIPSFYFFQSQLFSIITFAIAIITIMTIGLDRGSSSGKLFTGLQVLCTLEDNGSGKGYSNFANSLSPIVVPPSLRIIWNVMGQMKLEKPREIGPNAHSLTPSPLSTLPLQLLFETDEFLIRISIIDKCQ